MADENQDKELPEANAVKENLSLESPASPEEAFFIEKGLDYGIFKTHHEDLKKHYAHKIKWSWLLIIAIGGTFAFQFALIISVGLGALDFSDDQWLLPTFLVQSLGQVIGLALIVVRSLFSPIDNPLKTAITDSSPPQRRKSSPRRRHRWGR